MSNINIIVDFAHPNAISHTIRYARIDNTVNPSYTTVAGITSSPYTIQNVANGQYSIGITPVYADGRVCPEVFSTTEAASLLNSFSAILGGSPIGDIIIEYTTDAPAVRVNITYPNGGNFQQDYTNDGNDIEIIPPANLYGDYFVTLTPIEDEGSGFLGIQSAPLMVNIPAENNSRLSTASTGPFTNVAISATNISQGTRLVYQRSTFSSAYLTAYFYISDGYYSSIDVTNDSVDLDSATLVTGTGTYTGVITGKTATFYDVNASGGIIISITEAPAI